VSGAAENLPRLEPGAVLRFEFPGLPETLEAMDTGKRQPAVLTARLPENFTRGGRFPLFLYLHGHAGGRGEERDLRLGAYVIGRRDWIVATMPLFKKGVDPSEMARGLMVSMDDYPVIAASYRTMLERLFAAVPEIAPERSTFGGHSNGGHTTGVLLAMQDEFLFRHFRQFFLHEGGIGPLLANVLQKRTMRGPRFLVMMGSRSFSGKPAREVPAMALPQALEGMTRRTGLDFTFVTMRGYGHEQPPEYLRVIGQWARGEPLDDVQAKTKALAAALALPLRAHPDSSAWPDLLAPDLSNTTAEKSGVWRFEDGILSAAADGIALWSRNDFADCVLDLEYRCAGEGEGSVMLRKGRGKAPAPAPLEIELRTAPGPRESPATGAGGMASDHRVTTESAAMPAGEWNRLTITCAGANAAVLLNGQAVSGAGAFRPADLPASGRIGFAGRGVEFRHVKALRMR
jgi:hypothetical protein